MMTTTFARAYIWLILILQLLLFVISLFLSVTVFMGMEQLYGKLMLPIFRASVSLNGAIVPFIAYAPRWLTQVRTSPTWMWKLALIVAAYGFSTVFLQAVIPLSQGSAREALIYFGFPLGFDAVMLCILYSVLWARYLDDLEINRRVWQSLIVIALFIVLFVARPHWTTSPPFRAIKPNEF